MRARLMLFLLGCLLSLLFLVMACHDGGTVPITPPGPLAIAKISGDRQVEKVTRTLPSALVAQAYTQGGATHLRLVAQGVPAFAQDTGIIIGTPLPNKLVSFAVPREGCGRPYSNAETTDALGFVKQRWELGTKADAAGCDMEVRAVNQTTGLPEVYAVFHSLPKAFPVTQAVILNQNATYTEGEEVDIQALIVKAFDQYSNENTDYLVRYRRRNANPALNDVAPIANIKAIMRGGDFNLEIWTDSLMTNKPITVVHR